MILTWDKFNESSNESNTIGFNKINKNDILPGHQLHYSKLIKFPELEISKIEDLTNQSVINISSQSKLPAGKIYVIINEKRVHIESYQYEWFLVKNYISDWEISAVLYECDQSDGLINCLKYLIAATPDPGYIKDNYLDQGIAALTESSEDAGFTQVFSSAPTSAVDFNKYDIDKILNSVKEFKSDSYADTRKITITPIRSSKIRINIPSRPSIYVESMEDEWFLLCHAHVHSYKCDQIEGVINCIEKLLTNK